MLGLIIVDDEVLARVGVKSLIDWENEGYQILGEANNGAEGLQLIKEAEPDIVLTDIKMPIMDGLEMIKKGLENEIDTKFIVLSSYDDFYLVKKAMKLGAVDYLIKLELDEKVLLDTLRPVKEEIISAREKSRGEELLKHNINTENSMRKEFFKKLIGNLISDKEEINYMARELRIKLDSSCLMVMITRINSIDSLKKFDNKDLRIFEFSVTNIIQEIMDNYFPACVFLNSWGEVLTIFSVDRANSRRDYQNKLREMVANTSRMLNDYLDISTNTAISGIHHCFEELSEAYLEACKGLKYTFYCHSSEPVFYYCLEKYQSKYDDRLDLLTINRLLSKYLDTMDGKGLEGMFNKLTEKLERGKFTREHLFDFCGDLIYVINSQLAEADLRKVFNKELTPYRSIDRLGNKYELSEWVKDLGKGLINLVEEYKHDEKLFLIGQAKKYIHAHFTEDISLSEVAEQINISSGYLSSLFKDVEEKGLNEYLTELRIAEAKRMLRNSSNKIYRIS
ncbi:MAG TPA: response regulator, partial [Halanaerobiales bacterium]|nr:response regulator [Halanaerobiales bacterium]